MTESPSIPPPSRTSRLQFAESGPAIDGHGHFGLLYESQAEQFAVALPFVREGLERGERCCYATAESTEREIRDALQRTGIDVDEALESGALSIHDARELYLDDGEFSMEQLFENLEEMATQATDREGFAGLRISAEMAWLQDAAIEVDTFLDYEASVNHVFPETDLVGLCQYNRTDFPPAVIEEVVRTHPVLTVRETITANPYYRDPDEDNSLSSAGRPGHTLDVIDALQRRERGLGVLTDATPRLLQADRQEIAEIAVTTLRDAVQLPVAGLWLYDRDGDELQLEATVGLAPPGVDEVPAQDVDDAPPSEGTDAPPSEGAHAPPSVGDDATSSEGDDATSSEGDRGTSSKGDSDLAAWQDLAWQAYSSDELHTYGRLHEAECATGGPALRSALFVPVGGDGVLCAAAKASGAIDGTVVRVARGVAANTETALGRVDREQQLDERRDELTRYVEATRLLRKSARTVVDTATRSEVESVICEQLTALEDLRFAWIGVRDGDGITPRAWAGGEQGYLSDGPVSGLEASPAVRAAESGEPVVVSSIVDQLDAEEWRTATLSRDFRSAISVPVSYNDISYGVLTIYASRSAFFDDLLQSVITDVGKLLGQAIHLSEQRSALREHSVQELEFAITSSNFPPLQLSRHANCPLTVEGSLSIGGDRTIANVTVEGVSRNRIVDAVDAAVTITDAAFVRETAAGYCLSLTLETPFVDTALAEHGAVLKTVTADPTEARVVVDAPTAVDTHDIVDTIAVRYPDSELVAKRQSDRSLATFPDLQSQLLDQLTDRQLDVLTTAYHAGYFESPREKTGEEVAETLDITAQTFSQHLRRVQGKLVDALLADSSMGNSRRD